MQTKPLSVLITRPEEQGRVLAKALNQQGYQTHCQPLFGYQEKATLEQYHQTSANKPDIFIFVSVAAVQFANKVYPLAQWIKTKDKETTVIAVGQATANMLNTVGISNVLTPQKQTSEGVLALAELSQCNHQNIVIVRGNSGRELMFDTLIHRGAKVSYLESYQRHWHQLSTDISQHWQQLEINCIVITSNDLLQSVVQLIQLQAQASLISYWQQTCIWVVASKRIEENARALGLVNIVCAEGASDQAIISAINNMEQAHDRQERINHK